MSDSSNLLLWGVGEVEKLRPEFAHDKSGCEDALTYLLTRFKVTRCCYSFLNKQIYAVI